MDREELRGPDARHLDTGYASQEELLGDLSAWVDLLLYYYYSRHQWLGPSSDLRNMLGLVVSREEFEHNLTKAAQTSLRSRLSAEERAQADLARKSVALRVEHTAAALPLLALFSRCGLDEFEQGCVLLSYLATVDRKYEKLLAYLQDDMTQKAPGVSLAAQLFLPEGESMESGLARFSRRDGVFYRLFLPEELALGRLVLRPVVTEFLNAGNLSDRPGRRMFDGARERPAGALVVQGEIARQLDCVMDDPADCCVFVYGPAGGGKKFQVEHLMARCRLKCVFADVEGEGWLEQAEEAALAALLTGSALCLYHLDRRGENNEPAPAGGAMLRALERLDCGSKKRFFLSVLPPAARIDTLSVEIELPPVTETERLELFRASLRDAPLDGSFTPEELAAKFRFTPRQVRLSCSQAIGLARLSGEGRVGGKLIHQCCYQQVVHRLGELASKVPAAHSWEDVVLPEEQKRLMRHACSYVQHQHKVYFRWGFDKKISYGRGLSVLFAGAPGTGKTMCAQVMANQLNMEIYKINISQIVSKYIGETEKNLRAVFNEAKNASCILFFDECDALFGKRSEVKDSHDRNANVEVAYLLQQIEEYDGVCILATNLLGNIDEAFMRRITFVVRFPFPEAPMREEIYHRMMPAAAPVAEGIDWKFLAEKFELSGGHIKNIVLAAAFLAAGQGEEISMKHLLRAAVNEMKKNGIVVVREQLQEYADLLEEA